MTLRDLATDIYAAAVRGVDPSRATATAVEAVLTRSTAPYWLMAVGKASSAMASAALEVMAAQGASVEGGLVVGPAEEPPPHPAVQSLAGEHPIPGERSFHAANALGELTRRVAARSGGAGAGTVIVLVSGGATSLIAAPTDGVGATDLVRLFDGLLGSGADITVMNAVRKRFTRWGGGRLAVALAPARVYCLAVSDVVGDDLASIASGPCTPDLHGAADVAALIERHGLEQYVPRALRDLLAGSSGVALDETPKPGDVAFARVQCEVILGNRHALAAGADAARALGLSPVKVVAEPLVDDATFTAQRLVDELLRFREAGLLDGETPARFGCMIWGGETTVRLGTVAPEPGGRCQELALAAAEAMHAEKERAGGIALLAAGSDGRDGPTDAAGAVVDVATWDAIRTAGRDPADDLLEHRSHRALDAVGALVRTGLSGTNVGDIVVGIVERG